MTIRITQDMADAIRNDDEGCEWKTLARHGSKVPAIKAFRTRMGRCGLKEGKDCVELFMGQLLWSDVVMLENHVEYITVPNGHIVIKNVAGEQYTIDFVEHIGVARNHKEMMQHVANWLVSNR